MSQQKPREEIGFLGLSESPFLHRLKALGTVFSPREMAIAEHAMDDPKMRALFTEKARHSMVATIGGTKSKLVQMTEAMLPRMMQLDAGRKLILAGAAATSLFLVGCGNDTPGGLSAGMFQAGQAYEKATQAEKDNEALKAELAAVKDSLDAAAKEIQELQKSASTTSEVLGNYNTQIGDIIDSSNKNFGAFAKKLDATSSNVSLLGSELIATKEGLSQSTALQQEIVSQVNLNTGTIGQTMQQLSQTSMDMDMLASQQGNLESGLQELSYSTFDTQEGQQYLLNQIQALSAGQRANASVLASEMVEAGPERYLGSFSVYVRESYDQLNEVVIEFDSDGIERPFVSLYVGNEFVKYYGVQNGNNQYTFNAPFPISYHDWGNTVNITVGADTQGVFDDKEYTEMVTNFAVTLTSARFQDPSGNDYEEPNGSTLNVKMRRPQ